MLNKKVLILVAGFLISGAGILALLNSNRPIVRIEISSPHSPIHNIVKLDGKRLYPSGIGGKSYESKSTAGRHTISISGPFIRTLTKNLELGSSETKVETIDPEEITAEQILKNTLQNQEAKFSTIEVDGDVIFAITTGGEPDSNGDTTYPVFAKYQIASERWERLDREDLDDTIRNSEKFRRLVDENSQE